MQQINYLLIVLMMVMTVAAGNGTLAAEKRLPSDAVFLAIDLTYVSIGSESAPEAGLESEKAARPCGVEPVPWIVWRDGMAMPVHHAWIMTLDAATGAQKGGRLELLLPDGFVPVDAFWAKHFPAPLARGIEPSPWIVFRDYRIYIYAVSYAADGTPTAGSPVSFQPAVNPLTYGYATCITELPAAEFADGKPRAFIGTDRGYIVQLLTTSAAGVIVEEIHTIATNRIDGLQSIPQYGYVALGVLADNMVRGFDPEGTGGMDEVFGLVNLRPSAMTAFDVFGPDDAPLSDPDSEVRLIIADGTSDLALVSISASQTGRQTMTPTLDPHAFAVKSVVTGSLMTLADDGSSVTYDPDYSEQTGSSGCEVNITDGEADICGYICGDANSDGFVNVGDAVFLINYVFKSGPAPNPLCAGDANGDGGTNVGDAVYMINFVFKAGPVPAANCCS